MIDLHEFRRQYQQGGLRRKDLQNSPIAQFEQWFDELLKCNVSDPTAMILATVDSSSRPHQRIVLLKQVDEQGFTFFTNRQSSKGRDMQTNQQVSLHFPWHFIERQVIVSGTVELITKPEDEAYFASRPKESQWAAWASSQSEPIASRDELMVRFDSIKAQYPDEVPLPEYWGGYRVVPNSIEFWQGGENRLHDRFIYCLQDEANKTWSIQRISP